MAVKLQFYSEDEENSIYAFANGAKGITIEIDNDISTYMYFDADTTEQLAYHLLELVKMQRNG